MVPSQATGVGAGPGLGVIVFPQASTTVGGVGGTAALAQLTVEAPSTGTVKSPGVKVNV